MSFLQENMGQLIFKILEHLLLSLSALGLGILFALPLGLYLSRNKGRAQLLISLTSILQTIPSLALLAMMVPIFGVGKLPAIMALFIYSLLPILRNTVLGMESVDKDILDAAKGMGMTSSQIIFQVQLPLSIRVIMSGIRLSAVYVFAWASLAAYIGAGGLGDFIFNGLNNFDLAMILSGTLPITFMALLFDRFLGFLEKQMLQKANPVLADGEVV